eukprot:2854187-Pyramimonas_sp.AAC.1
MRARGFDFSDAPAACRRPRRRWVVPWSGASYFAAHPALRGRQIAVPARRWRPSMLRRRGPQGRCVAELADALPAGMDAYLLSKILSA